MRLKNKGEVNSPPPLFFERGSQGTRLCRLSPGTFRHCGGCSQFKRSFALLVGAGRAHGVHPTLVQLLLLLHDPFLLPLRLRIVAFVSCALSTDPSPGCTWGPASPCPPSSRISPCPSLPSSSSFLSSSLNCDMVYNPLRPVIG